MYNLRFLSFFQFMKHNEKKFLINFPRKIYFAEILPEIKGELPVKHARKRKKIPPADKHIRLKVVFIFSSRSVSMSIYM